MEEREEGEKEEWKMDCKAVRHDYDLHPPSSLLGLAEFIRSVKDRVGIFNTHNLQGTRETCFNVPPHLLSSLSR